MKEKRGMDQISKNIRDLIKIESNARNDATITNSILSGLNYSLTTGIPVSIESSPSSIRDMSDGVVYFMVGVDLVNSPAKVKKK